MMDGVQKVFPPTHDRYEIEVLFYPLTSPDAHAARLIGVCQKRNQG